MLRFHARLAIVAAALLASASLSIGAGSASAATYLYAPWWNGSACDSAHWNSVAASKGWDIKADPAHPLGASYRGVQACGPQPGWDRQGTRYAPNVAWTRSGWVEYEWQCVELAMRFMKQIYGVTAYGANGWNVAANYRTAYGGGLTRYSNPTTGRAPQPGDIISFGTTSPGHAAVVTATAVDANGNGTITVMSQNDGSTNGYRTLTVTAWKVGAFGGRPATKWLHQNVITFGEWPAGKVITSQYKSQGVLLGGYNPSGSPVNPTVRSDTLSATSPVLSGSPAFKGGIRGRFVKPGTTTSATVGTVILDIGHLTAANTIRVTFLNSTGGTVKSVLISKTGLYRASATGAIASFAVFEVTAGVGTFSLDNLVSGPNYT